ncbi:hypothetical protein GPECTOR_78g63 [Gonium pectorale]|uniref:Uncharacterized protein n=1 Tax=Gonium pectorale TaxID=33097 RepID=A0A150G2Y8_GONPE|nr:hypothetical protein GPECTOR_78g63 [Gonium pectorale]|eukprot:KXZ43875.1 hypothetical protein GPECTOR_78g63 [Gonium pectorale]
MAQSGAKAPAAAASSDAAAASRRQRYDYRLRLDPAAPAQTMAGVLVEALGRHEVVLSEVVGGGELHRALHIIATARELMRQGRARQGPPVPPQDQDLDLGRSLPGDLGVQVLLPKQPYIRSRQRNGGSEGSDSDRNGGGAGGSRVWRLYTHRVPAAAVSGGEGGGGSGGGGGRARLVVPAEPPVRLHVTGEQTAREVADVLGPAVVRDGQVALLADGDGDVGGGDNGGAGEGKGTAGGAGGLRLLVRLCRGSRPDVPVLGQDEMLMPA